MATARKRHQGGTFQVHVKKGDQVSVRAGRSLNQAGRVISVDPQRERAIVEGVNTIIKHQKSQGSGRSPQAAAQQQSGRITKPAPIHSSNLMIICPTCNSPTRVAHRLIEGKQARICKRCSAALDRAK